MGRVTAYKASDNELMPTRKAWFRYEANLLVKAALIKKLTEQVTSELGSDAGDDAIQAEVTKRLAVFTAVGIDQMRDWFELTFKPPADEEAADPQTPAAPASTSATPETPAAPAAAPAAPKAAADEEI
ncbi:hypothetical protein [Comamonas thiooxydans]|uniref:hypothetical protein n=1 Tax=Comamonas thiooxydans TaxID=363952 RepID=UPI000B41D03E|nr:hypothetical protein [Comamonas thiooxydans]